MTDKKKNGNIGSLLMFRVLRRQLSLILQGKCCACGKIEVMKLFWKRKGQVVSRKELIKTVWHMPKHPNERIVDNVIVSLRKYFEKDSQNPEYILNVRGVGYKFVN